MTRVRLSDHLLEPDHWPAVVANSKEVHVLRAVAELSLRLDEQTTGDADTDGELHAVYRACARIAGWLPQPARGRTPHYTRTAWDLRALSALIPSGMDLRIDSDVEQDDRAFTRWQANLHDHIHGNHAAHPSFLEHNAALSYDGGQYGSAWTPNLALARILLAAHLLAAIQVIQARTLPAPNRGAHAPQAALAAW